MKHQLFLVLGPFRANFISGSALNLFQLVHLISEMGISLGLYHGKKTCYFRS
jgi:hypothetical protein